MTKIMEPLRHDLVGFIRSRDEVSNIIGKLISQTFRVDIIQAESKQVDIGDINISANYDPDLDSMDRPCIELILVYNPLDPVVLFDEELFTTITKRLCDSISHEQIHQQQHRARFWESWYYDTDNEEQYLANKDEIDAFSLNITNELLDYTDAKNALTLLQYPSTIKIEHSVNLWAYIKTFKGNVTHPVIKRLLKKVVKLLPVVEQQR